MTVKSYAAPAAVTETLKARLTMAIQRVPGARVTTRPPEEMPAGSDKNSPRVNLYLFQVLPNASFRNADLPTRDGSGQLTQQPQVALDLFYLLSFYGDENLASQQLLGLSSLALDVAPYLAPREIEDATRGTPFEGSGLSQQPIPVRVSPISMRFDELAKFWSGFSAAQQRTQFTLSLVYCASVVLLDAQLTPKATLPVAGAGPTPQPSPAAIPRIDATQLSAPQWQPSLTVTLIGAHLGGPGTVVLVGDAAVEAGTDAPPADRLTFALPAGVAAGSVPVVAGFKRQGRSVPASNRAAFTLRPLVLDGAGEEPVYDPGSPAADPPLPPTITVQVKPEVRRGQTTALQLNPLVGRGDSATLRGPIAGAATGNLVFDAGTVAPGDYLVRAVVDGVASLPQQNAQGRYDRPTVTVPAPPAVGAARKGRRRG